MAKTPEVRTFDTTDEFEEFRFEGDGLVENGIYHILNEDSRKTDDPEPWAYSPDGIGCYWYDSEEELREDAGL